MDSHQKTNNFLLQVPDRMVLNVYGYVNVDAGSVNFNASVDLNVNVNANASVHGIVNVNAIVNFNGSVNGTVNFNGNGNGAGVQDVAMDEADEPMDCS